MIELDGNDDTNKDKDKEKDNKEKDNSKDEGSGDEDRKVITLPITGKSAPVIPVPTGQWLDLLFPAIVHNPNKALTYICEELTDKTTDVSLKFRPNNPSCIPIKTKVTPSVKLILRVNKRTKQVRVCGVISKEISFTRLADFQLQYPPAPPKPNYCGVKSDLVDWDYLTRDEHMRVNAQYHAMRDKPFDYFFQQHVPASMTKGEMRQRPPRPSAVIHWKSMDLSIPTAPLKMLQSNEIKQNYFNLYKEKIEEMFRSRPIWSTAAFTNTMDMGVKEVNVRTILLPYFAYYCNLGPWRGMWIKFGYDPRTDQVNRKYQLIDFRAPRQYDMKESLKKYSENKKADLEGLKACHIYLSSKLPFKRQSHYQVCDVQDTRCQAVLKNYETTTFSHDNGYYSKGALPAVRAVMIEQCRDLLDKMKCDVNMEDEIT